MSNLQKTLSPESKTTLASLSGQRTPEVDLHRTASYVNNKFPADPQDTMKEKARAGMKLPLLSAIWALPPTEPGKGERGRAWGQGSENPLFPGLGSAADKPETTIPVRRGKGGGWSWPSGPLWLYYQEF